MPLRHSTSAVLTALWYSRALAVSSVEPFSSGAKLRKGGAVSRLGAAMGFLGSLVASKTPSSISLFFSAISSCSVLRSFLTSRRRWRRSRQCWRSCRAGARHRPCALRPSRRPGRGRGHRRSWYRRSGCTSRSRRRWSGTRCHDLRRRSRGRGRGCRRNRGTACSRSHRLARRCAGRRGCGLRCGRCRGRGRSPAGGVRSRTEIPFSGSLTSAATPLMKCSRPWEPSRKR